MKNYRKTNDFRPSEFNTRKRLTGLNAVSYDPSTLTYYINARLDDNSNFIYKCNDTRYNSREYRNNKFIFGENRYLFQ